MEVYIHLYHFISSGEWRFIFIFTPSWISTSIPRLKWRCKDEYKTPFPTWNEVVKMNINLHSQLEMKWKRWI
jgi:hypothetical protein